MVKHIVVTVAIALVVFFVASMAANASRTMKLVDSYRNGDQKICVYSDGMYTATTTHSLAGACPSIYIDYQD